ncbi:MAG: hypothetical protein PHP44_06145 [Kiritimatiellae bacterium]|nr:hypothetical protein [Kiritimatiellia bacterium]
MKKNKTDYQERVAKYPDIHAPEKIASTATDLENMKYHPILLIDTPNFLHMNSADLLNELNRLSAMSAEDWTAAGCPDSASHAEFREKHIGLLLYHYALLYRLRNDEPEAWDEINALYEDD